MQKQLKYSSKFYHFFKATSKVQLITTTAPVSLSKSAKNQIKPETYSKFENYADFFMFIYVYFFHSPFTASYGVKKSYKMNFESYEQTRQTVEPPLSSQHQLLSTAKRKAIKKESPRPITK